MTIRQIDNTCKLCNQPVANFSCGPTDEHCPMVDGTGSGSPCCNYDAGLEPWDICPCYDNAEYQQYTKEPKEFAEFNSREDEGVDEYTEHDCDRGVTDDNLPQDFGNTGRFSDW